MRTVIPSGNIWQGRLRARIPVANAVCTANFTAAWTARPGVTA
jgi:hypothetical protein